MPARLQTSMRSVPAGAIIVLLSIVIVTFPIETRPLSALPFRLTISHHGVTGPLR